MQQARLQHTLDEYFEIEASSETKHEFYRGEIVAMTGASLNHNRIVMNLLFALTSALTGKRCEVFASDMRLRLRDNVYVYPDVTVACGAVQLTADPLDTLSNCRDRSAVKVDRELRSRIEVAAVPHG
jgi:Uma2 family endonuclease